MEVIDADVLLGRVSRRKLVPLRGKGEPIGILKILGKQLELAIGRNSINPLKGNLLLLILGQVGGWIGEVMAPSGPSTTSLGLFNRIP